ncbi:hypothetical protein K456DRAFT_1920905 [Colletotrichum gloeosporioides 23]|nr:hypothetical protein K456DRAFT_1920905 [Colletotrichum gloeosporioides 23]
MSEFTISLVPESDSGSFHLPDRPDEAVQQNLINTSNQSSALSMKIKIAEVYHGHMIHDDKTFESSLILFEMWFLSSEQARRYRSISVTLEFLDQAGHSRRHPTIAAMAPQKMHWLNETTYERTTRYGSNITAQFGMNIANAGTSAHWEAEATKPVHFKATLTGRATSSRNHYATENAAIWTMEENRDEKIGVPSYLQTAVFLRRGSSNPFSVRLQVRSDVDIVSGLRRTMPFTTDVAKILDDATFDPHNTQTNGSKTTGVETSALDHMERLPVDQYFRVNFQEEKAGTTGNVSLEGKEGKEFTTQEGALHTPSTQELPYLSRRLSKDKVTHTAAVNSATLEVVAGAAEAAAKAAEAASRAAEACARAAEVAARVVENIQQLLLKD